MTFIISRQKLEEALTMPWVKGMMEQFLPEALVLPADGDLDEAAPRLQDAINLVSVSSGSLGPFAS